MYYEIKFVRLNISIRVYRYGKYFDSKFHGIFVVLFENNGKIFVYIFFLIPLNYDYFDKNIENKTKKIMFDWFLKEILTESTCSQVYLVIILENIFIFLNN